MSVLNPFLRRARAFFVIACVAMLAAGCGGGVGNGGTGIDDGGGDGTVVAPPPGSPGFVQGPITNLGPVVVDGVTLDTSDAGLVDENGLDLNAGLGLGMVVTVWSTPVAANAATASTFVVHTDLIGPVSAAYDAVTGRFEVMGQVVQVDANTCFAIGKGALELEAGDAVAISAQYDPSTGVYLATRVDKRDDPRGYTIRGAATDIDRDAATFRIGTQVFDFAGVSLPDDFDDGVMVRVLAYPTRSLAGHWVVNLLDGGAIQPQDDYVGRKVGVVGSALPGSAYFFVDGVPVDAGAAKIVPAGAAIVPGNLVDLHGSMYKGLLSATEVDVVAAGDADRVTVPAALDITSLIVGRVDLSTPTFAVTGGTIVDYTNATFVGGTAADLPRASTVRVQGRLSADGTQVVASTVTFVGPLGSGGGGGR